MGTDRERLSIRRQPRLRRAVAWLLPLLPSLPLLAAACAGLEAMTHVAPSDPVGRGTLIVVNAGAASVSLLDALTGDRIVDLPVGEGPGDVAVSPGGGTAVVANHGAAADGHTLSLIDISAATVTGTIELGQHGRPGGLCFVSDGRRLLAASGATGALLLVDIPTRRLVRAVSTGQSHSSQLVLQPDGVRVWITHGAAGSVSAIDVQRLVRVVTLQTGAGAEGLDISPDGGLVWVCNRGADTLAVIDTEELEVVQRLPCPGGPSRVRFTPDGARVFVTCPQAGDVAVFDVGERRQVARIPLLLTPLEIADSRLFGQSLSADSLPDIAPTDVLLSRNGERAWVTHAQAHIVSVLDSADLDVTGRLRTGQAPQGLAWTPRLPGQY